MDTVYHQGLGVEKCTAYDFYDAEKGVKKHSDQGNPGGSVLLLFQVGLRAVVCRGGLFHYPWLQGFLTKASIP
jgi:hypothetical protein